MNIEISCESFEADGYSSKDITLKLNKVSFGGNGRKEYNEFVKRFYPADVISNIYNSDELIPEYDESEIIELLSDDTISMWSNENINIDNIEEFIDESVLQQYMRDKKIDYLVNDE